MKRKYIFYVLTLTLFCFLIILVTFFEFNWSQPKVQAADQEEAPHLTYISGSGVVEPASGNVLIAPSFNRTIEKINVAVNDKVKKGEVLFQLYNQDLKINLKIKQKKYDESLSNLHKLKLLPQDQDLILAQESLRKAQAAYDEASLTYCLSKRRAKCKTEKCLQFYKYQQAEADFLMAQAQYEKVRSGAWKPELVIAQDSVDQALAEVEGAEAEIERTYIRSPLDGTVLQIKIREGETSDQNKIAMVVGDVVQLNLRVEMDQFNTARFQVDSTAVAFKRGDHSMEYPLKFLHIEPVMVPKKYLTNELSERVDTQIFEIIYRIEKKDARLFIGELMDVYIYFHDNSQKEQHN